MILPALVLSVAAEHVPAQDEMQATLGWFEAADPADWRATAERLAREIRPADLPRWLSRHDMLAPAHGLPLRIALSRPRFRTALLATCRLEEVGALAREVLIEEFRVRLRDAAAFSDAVHKTRESAPLLTPPGLRLQAIVPAGFQLDVAELLWTLRDAEVLAGPLAVAPAAVERLRPALDRSILRQPAEWALRRLLRQRGLTAVRLLWGLWIVPETWVDEWPEEVAEDELVWRDRLASVERDFLARSLPPPGSEEDPLPIAVARAALLSALGLPLLPEDGGAAAWVAAAERWRVERVGPPPPVRDPWTDAWLRRAVAFAPEAPADPALLHYRVALREAPTCRRRAAEWLSGAADVLPAEGISRLSAALTEDPAGGLWRVARGELPLDLAARLLDGLDAAAAGAALDRVGEPVDGGIARTAVRCWLGLDEDVPEPSVAARIAAGDPFDPTALRAALAADTPPARAIAELAAVADIGAQLPAVLDEILQQDDARAADRFLGLLAARVDAEPLLAGRCRQQVKRFLQQHEAPAAWIEELSEELWDLGKLTRSPDWLLVLTDRPCGMVPRE